MIGKKVWIEVKSGGLILHTKEPSESYNVAWDEKTNKVSGFFSKWKTKVGDLKHDICSAAWGVLGSKAEIAKAFGLFTLNTGDIVEVTLTATGVFEPRKFSEAHKEGLKITDEKPKRRSVGGYDEWGNPRTGGRYTASGRYVG